MFKCICGARYMTEGSLEIHGREHCPAIHGDKPGDAPAGALERQVGGGHYKDKAIQPIEYIHANGLSFIEGSVVKYISRWREKGGVQDLEKIKHYVDLLIELEGREQPAQTR